MCVELGDAIAGVLSTIGITPTKVSKWLDTSCNCEERKERLNQLSVWSKRVLAGKTHKAYEYLSQILDG